MTLPVPADPNQAADVQRRYPEWDIRRSGTGRWWAIARERVLLRGTGVRAVLDADDLGDLDDLLAEQQRLRGRQP